MLFETGAPGDSRGSWSSLSCGNYNSATGARTSVGGLSGDPLHCYGAPSAYVGAWTKCSPPGAAGGRWGSCKFWRSWCSSRFDDDLGAAQDKADVLERWAAESIETGIPTDFTNWIQQMAAATGLLNRLVGGGVPGTDPYVPAAEGSATAGSHYMGPDDRDDHWCRHVLPARYHGGVWGQYCDPGGQNYPEPCQHGEGERVHPLSYYPKAAAAIRSQLAIAEIAYESVLGMTVEERQAEIQAAIPGYHLTSPLDQGAHGTSGAFVVHQQAAPGSSVYTPQKAPEEQKGGINWLVVGGAAAAALLLLGKKR